ncbi:hypothetical protein GCM10012275_54820 [Longimycelium tulufanense]|uniref:FtsK domain-containing protein n=1 Tax=Longimycelium tulufanense TaxID=907463 RepID=A0A8J3CJC7_9PSEU|nr:hypothetical protein [Longimycelium tulufanense]GGM77226.1 hypothetical protein GCM10012275_54820 [Longimycelium tulufanense]
MTTNEVGTWSRLASQPGPNPLWFHPLLGLLWAGFAGCLVDLLGYDWWWVPLVGVGTVPAAVVVARSLITPGTPRQRRARGSAGRLAGWYWLVVTGWTTYAAAFGVLRPPDWPAFGALTFLMLLHALGYADIRHLLLPRPATPDTTVQAEETAQRSSTTEEPDVESGEADTTATAPVTAEPRGVAPEHTADAAEWVAILRDVGLGDTRVLEWKETNVGPCIEVELDPDRADTSGTVKSKLREITGLVTRRWKTRGVQVTDGAIEVREAGSADTVTFMVRLRNPLAGVVEVPPDEGITTCNEPLWLGLYETGASLEMDLRYRHGIAVGTTGSGKSTYENMIIYQLTRCMDALAWMCGTAKLLELAGPWLTALADGRASRPVIDYVEGQSWESVARMLRVAYVLCKIRETAPRRLYERENNRLLPGRDQPLVHIVIEEADTVLKSPTLIPVPGETPLTAGQIIMYLTSKGRQYGIQVELLNQGVTINKMGALATEIKGTCTRRAAFSTMTRAEGTWALPDGANLDTSKLPEHCFYLSIGKDSKPEIAKAAYIDEEVGIPQAAIRHQTWVTCLEPYAQQKLRERVGDDYASRWSHKRTQVWRDYFGKFPCLPDGDTGTVPVGTAAVSPAGTVWNPHGGVPGERDGKRGWFYGDIFVPDLSQQSPQSPTVGTPRSPHGRDNRGDSAGDSEGGWDRRLLEQIRGLDEVPEPARHPVPEPLATIVARLAGDTREHVTTAELARLVDMDATTLGAKLTELGVPSRKRGGERGRLVADLRSAAEAWRRGEPPTAISDEE